MTTQMVWGTVAALGIAMIVERSFERRATKARTLLIGVIFLVPVYYLLLSAGYFPGLVIGATAFTAAFAIVKRRSPGRLALGILAYVYLGAATYIFAYHVNQQAGTSGGSAPGVGLFIGHPLTFVKALLAACCSSILDSRTVASMSHTSVLIIGGALALVVIGCIYLFFKTHMYDRSYIPIYCFGYSFSVVGAQFVGRGSLVGWVGITSEWYSMQLRFIVIGVVMVIGYVVDNALRTWLPMRSARSRGAVKRSVLIRSSMCATALVGIASSQVISNIHQWHESVYIKQYFENIEDVTVYPSLSSNPASAVVAGSKKSFIAERKVLSTYHLSSFSNPTLAGIDSRLERSPVLSGEWYPDNWVGTAGQEKFVATSSKHERLEVFLPAFIRNDHVTVSVNGLAVLNGSIAASQTLTRTISVHSGVNVLTVKCSNAAEPAHIGAGRDTRQLAVHLSFSSIPH
jgi:hypothetical protein